MQKGIVAVIVVIGAIIVGGYVMCHRPDTTDRSPLSPTSKNESSDPPSRSAEVTEAVEKLSAAWDAISAVSAKVQTQIPNAAGLPGLTSGKGTYDYRRSDSQKQIRFYLLNNLSFLQEDQSQLMTAELVLHLYDGVFLWLLVNQPEYRHVTKAHYDTTRVFLLGGRELLEQILDSKEVRLLQPESLDGKEMIVLETIPHEGDWRTKHWFDPETGIRMKLFESDADGAERLTLTVSEVNLTPTFAEDRFVLEVPEDFELTDETQPAP